jgi:hypothetical protein
MSADIEFLHILGFNKHAQLIYITPIGCVKWAALAEEGTPPPQNRTIQRIAALALKAKAIRRPATRTFASRHARDIGLGPSSARESDVA